MQRFIAILFLSLAAALGAGGCGSATSGSCTSTFTPCGGSLVGTWTVEAACGTAVLEMQCPGATATIDASPNASGTYTFNADGTYSSSLTIDESSTATLPASCMSGVTDCAMDDEMFTADGLAVASSCSGNAAESCTCTISYTGTVTSMGKYATAGNDFSLTPSGGTASPPTPYCVAGSTLQIAPPLPIGVSSSSDTYHLVLSKQ